MNVIAALLRTVWGHNMPVPPVLIVNAIRPALNAYIGRHAKRFAAIAARWLAGTLRRPPVRAPRGSDAAAVYDRPLRPRPGYDPPRPRGWLGEILSLQGRRLGRQLHELLRTDPELRALLEAAPQLTRTLGPLLRALGQTPGPGVLPKLPPRPSRAKPAAVRAAAAAAAAAARPPRPAKPGTKGYFGLRPRDSWMPHHPAQVRARLSGYQYVRPSKRS